jgi:hypothetical protein
VSYVTGPLGSNIPLYYQGHAYRTGSRIRVTISAPNGDQPIWSFGETLPNGTEGQDRALAQAAVEAPAPGRAGARGADRAPDLSGSTRRALPRLPADRQPQGLSSVVRIVKRSKCESRR